MTAAAAASARTSANRRILIIDDNPHIHGDFAKIFAPPAAADSLQSLDALETLLYGGPPERGATEPVPPAASAIPLRFDLAFASQGKEGVAAIAEARQQGRPFALAFVDMRMPPGWDGLETISKIWEVDDRIEIVICTAYSDHSWQEIIDHLGHSDRLLILKKPFDVVEVIQLAHSLTQKWSVTESLRRHLSELDGVIQARTQELKYAVSTLKHEATEHRQALASLSEMKERIEAMIRTVPVVMIGIGSSGVVTHWNRLAETMLGVPPSRAIGTLLNALDVPWPKDAIQGLIAAARAGAPPSAIAITLPARGGRGVAHLHVCATALPAPAQDVLLYANDCTARTLAEQQLAEDQKLAVIGQLAVSLTKGITHPAQDVGEHLADLGEAFTSITQLLEEYRLLAQRVRQSQGDNPAIAVDLQRLEAREQVAATVAFDTSVPKVLEQAGNGVDRIRTVITALGHVARQDHGEREWTDLHALIHDILVLARDACQGSVEVRFECGAGMPKVYCCAGEITQVLLLLLFTAAEGLRDHRAAEARLIRVATRTHQGSVELTVSEMGHGPASAGRSPLAKPSRTAPAGLADHDRLALARKLIVQSHGGTFDVLSHDGLDTTVAITLPIGGRGVGAAL